MLQISAKQYQSLADDYQTRWRHRLAKWLRKCLSIGPEQHDAAIVAMIERQEARAARFALVTERGIGKWCCLAWVTGEQFDHWPEFADDLSNAAPETVEDLLDSWLDRLDRSEL